MIKILTEEGGQTNGRYGDRYGNTKNCLIGQMLYISRCLFWVFFAMPLFEEKVFITFHGWEEIYPVPVKNIVIRKISELLSNGIFVSVNL